MTFLVEYRTFKNEVSFVTIGIQITRTYKLSKKRNILAFISFYNGRIFAYGFSPVRKELNYIRTVQRPTLLVQEARFCRLQIIKKN